MTTTKLRKFPDWYLNLSIPDRLREKLEKNFTPHRDGWVKWYKDKVRFICSLSTPPEEVEDRWHDRRREIDGAAAGKPVARRIDPSGMTVKLLCSKYTERQRRRVETGRPKPLSPFTLEDEIRTLREFIAHVGGDTLVHELSPVQFNEYAATFDKRAASTLARKIAYVKAMFSWGAQADVCPPPRFGPDFVKPPASVKRDQRISKTKSYTPEEMAIIWEKASAPERLWIGLAINGAMDNSDLANLTTDVIDLENGVLDYRRRKTGKVRRLIPLVPEVLTMLKKHHIPPTEDRRVFSTPEGFPLVRMRNKTDGSGRSTPIDYIAFRWTKLLQRAELKEKPQRIVVCEKCGKLQEVIRKPCVHCGHLGFKKKQQTSNKHGGDGRGFRGLRTTFANNAPPGYSDERKIVMGHSHGDTFLDDYLEKVGTARITEMVGKVWAEVFKGRGKQGRSGKKKPTVGGV